VSLVPENKGIGRTQLIGADVGERKEIVSEGRFSRKEPLHINKWRQGKVGDTYLPKSKTQKTA